MEGEEGDLKFSRIFDRTLDILARNPLSLLSISAVTLYLPSVLLNSFWPAPVEGVFSWQFAVWSFAIVPGAVAAGVFSAWIALQEHQRDRGPLRALGAVLSRFIPLLVTTVVVTVVGVIGAFLLVVPGIIWALACTVVLPVFAIEREGPSEAIRRSFVLTQNRRWAIFGYTLILYIPWALAILLLELALSGWSYDFIEQSKFINDVSRPITDTVGAMVGAAFSAAIYFELIERVHEG